MNEPTSALDHDRGAAVIDLITRLTHQRGTAAVLVTHDRAHLAAVDRIADMHDGRLGAPAPAGKAASVTADRTSAPLPAPAHGRAG